MKWIFQRFSSPQKCATCSGFSVRHAPDLLCDIDRIQCATCSGLCIQVIIADKKQHSHQIQDLFWEYLQWANNRVQNEFNVSFDIATMLEEDMRSLAKFMPPQGRLLLGYRGNDLAGIACLKFLKLGVGEVKRMYVRPSHRQAGVGRTLLSRLLQEARQIGYQSVKLDSAHFMKEAHQLYQSMGFRKIPSYEGSEIPKEFQEHWIFMELTLEPHTSRKSKK